MINISVYSFFSGAGFLDLGFEASGFEVVYVNEIHKPFLDAYKFARSKMRISSPKYGYFNKSIDECLSGNEFEKLSRLIKEDKKCKDFVGFIGGPPCPDFSVGGKNRGRHGDNGKLSQSYIELICSLQPDFFIFENVKGLYRTAKHREFFDSLKNLLHQNNYYLTERLINSFEYGAPQDRERIILFGVKKDILDTISITNFDWYKYIKYSKDEVLSFPWPQIGDTSFSQLIPKELTVDYWFKKNNVSNHPNQEHVFIPRAGLEKFKIIAEGDNKKKSYKRLHRFKYSPTAAYGNNEVHIHPTLPRRISAAEALAIQSLPKEFVLPTDMTLSNMFKTIGNGVPYLAAKGIALTVYDFMEKINENNR